MAIFSTLFAVMIVAYYILKKYNSIFTFLFSGLVLLIFAFYYFDTPIPRGSRTGEFKPFRCDS